MQMIERTGLMELKQELCGKPNSLSRVYLEQAVSSYKPCNCLKTDVPAKRELQ